MKYTFEDLKSFYSNKNILVTGHTGFKGGWLSLFLKHLNANVFGISIDRLETSCKAGFDSKLVSDELIVDINDIETYKKKLKNFKPEIIFYLAAQPFVREAFLKPVETFQSNVLGLIHFLNFLRNIDESKLILIVTSDKVYEDTVKDIKYKETDRLGGVEPYSASKAIQEIISKCFYESYFKDQKKIITVRAGNVIGGGDFGKDRLIVDIINSIKNNSAMNVRYPSNTRPWQYVLDLIHGYLCTVIEISKDNKNFETFNFAPKFSYPVSEILEFSSDYWGNLFKYSVDQNRKNIFEQNKLSINSQKIKKLIGWQTKNKLSEILLPTFEWYKLYLEGNDMKKINNNMIQKFVREL